MKVKIKFHAICRELAGADSVELDLPEKFNKDEFWKNLINICPELKNISPNVALAHNNKYVKSDFQIKDGDTISLIPPVSGG